MAKTFTSFSFGCRVNQAEKEALDRQLMARGYTVNEEQPDIFIINTCSVTHKAEREARQMINQIRKKHEDTKIVVMGCAATNWIKTKATIEHADMIVENPSKEYIADLIEQKFSSRVSTTTSKGRNMPKSTPLASDKYIRSGRAIFKIQDGCQRFCTYCIVPYLRGLPQSVPMETLIGEINALPATIREVIYAAINTEAYGYDTKTFDFLDLVRETLEKTTVERLSFGSIHPWSVNEKLFDFMRNHLEAHRMVKFFHIPLQSGNNKMLNLMKRGYTREEFIEKLRTLVEIEPMAFIGTDIITGFLEETDADFEDTYRFLDETPVSKIHIFRYSPRQHTAAFYLGKRLQEPDPEVKKKRAKALAELNDRKYRAFQEKHIGKTFSALLLEQRAEDRQQAVLDNQMVAWITVPEGKTGSIVPVKIDAVREGMLAGRLS